MPILQSPGEPERAGEARRADSASANNYHYHIKIRTLISDQRATSFTVRKIRGQGPQNKVVNG